MRKKTLSKRKSLSAWDFLSTRFIKVEAAGNDFIIFEASLSGPLPEDLPQMARALCRPKFGIGADGLILIDKKSRIPRWRFFNSDGSETGVCGNAARAVTRFLKKSGQIKWQGSLGLFLGESLPGDIASVSWTSVKLKEAQSTLPADLSDVILNLNDYGLAGMYLLNVGVPHLVLLGHEIWSVEQRFGSSETLRRFPSLGPEGANVTWVSLKNFTTVTYERGVEGETLSCGSGALAAYLAVNSYNQENNPQDFKESPQVFHFPGGDLSVSRDREGRIWLKGPVKFIFDGKRRIP